MDTHSAGGRKGLKGKDFRKNSRGREDEGCWWRGCSQQGPMLSSLHPFAECGNAELEQKQCNLGTMT